MRFIYTLICVVLFGTSFAQEQPTRIDRALALYDRYEYANAIPLLLTIVEKDNGKNIEYMEKLAMSYAKVKDFAQAEQWFSKIVNHSDHKPEHVFFYGQALKSVGKYELAKEQFNKYSKTSSPTLNYVNEIKGIDSALVWKNTENRFQVENVKNINSNLSDFSPFLLRDSVFFISERENEGDKNTYGWTGRPFLKVYKSSVNADFSLNGPELSASSINSFGTHIGPIASPDNGKTIYVSITYPGKSVTVEKVNGTKYVTQRLGLFIYTLNDGIYSEPVPFPYNDLEKYSLSHPAFSLDGQTLYFASDMPGGFGGSDIWYSEKQADGTWGNPVNAGSLINSSGDELFPTINADGHLYYSSDGLPGLGGLDIFQAVGSKKSWTQVQNMGFVINSSADDFSYILINENDDFKKGFISSNRFGGVGEDDIYSFTYQKPAKPIFVAVKGTVFHEQTKLPLEAQVKIAEAGGLNPRMVETKEDGKFFFDLELNKEYEILGEKLKFDSNKTGVNTLNITSSDTLTADLYLNPTMVVGRTFVLENLYYDFDKHHIRPDAALILDDLIKILNEYPSMKIELSSHTDSRGSDSYNQALSQRRAQAAVEYLIKHGISRSRLVAKGYGETRLLNECSNGVSCSEEAHQLNRRTEFTILELNENI